MFDPGTHGNLAQIRHPPEYLYLQIQRLTAAIIYQSPALKSASFVAQRELPVHLRRNFGKNLRRRSKVWIHLSQAVKEGFVAVVFFEDFDEGLHVLADRQRIEVAAETVDFFQVALSD